MEAFKKPNYSQLRLLDGSEWIVFANRDDLFAAQDFSDFWAIEIIDRKEFEFLFWNGIDFSIPKDKTQKITIRASSILVFTEGAYESIVLR